MIKKIARDVSDELNATPSKDFQDMVGLEAHLKKIQSLLHLDYMDEAMIVGISRPVGIGKTTIARALQSLLSDRFQLTCFLDLRGSDPSGLHDYGLQLHLQEQLLSELLNQEGTRICHLEVLPQRLCDLRVLIILDHLNDVRQLKVLAKKTTWFGPGSRIIVTTEDKGILQQHGINNTYHVGFPSTEAALEIFCKYAFERISPSHGFKELAARITHLCGNLPLGLCVIGSSLFGKNQDEWECVVSRLETILDRDIEDLLRVGYESLDENEQTLFLHIAVFFNNINGDLMKTMFADSDLDVKYGLKILENRFLISTYGDQIVMHRLLQKVGKKAIDRQEPWKRQILIDAHEICDVLEDAKGTGAVSGISFDISNIEEVSISKKVFKRMPNLQFLRIYKSIGDGNYRMHMPEEMEFPRRLRLLDWKAYPSKSLPPTFNPEYLVGLNMRESQLEKLWEGTKRLENLKYMDLSASKNLKELPDLSNATNLEKLMLNGCESLVEIPSSFSHLHKLMRLEMNNCRRLASLPELPSSLIELIAENCEALETMFFPLSTPNAEINFTNCFKLGQQARRGIIRRSFCYRKTIIPGREVPAEFDNRAKGSSLTIVLDGNRSYTGFVFCVVISPNQPIPEYRYSDISWRSITAQDDGYPVEGFVTVDTFSICQMEHLVIFHHPFGELIYRPEVSREMMFAFRSESSYLEIIECGAKILTQEESIEWCYESGSDQVFEDDKSGSDQPSEDDIEFDHSEEAFEDNTEYGDPTNTDCEKQTDCSRCLPLKKRALFRGRRR